MRIHKLTIEPKSPFITPLQSDTIFGHLAWAIIYDQGEHILKEILAEFASSNPPFVISSAFPEGMLPTPILPILTKKETETLAIEYDNIEYKKNPIKSLRCFTEELKKTKKLNYIPIETFHDLAKNLNPITLIKTLLSLITKPNIKHSQEETVMHTSIDRITGTAKEGLLFDYTQTFYNREAKLTIWLKFNNNSWKNNIYRWFKIIEGSGFGKRKSTGLGQFHIIGDIKEASNELPQVAESNGFLSLSSYVPRADESCHGYYRYIIKRGKLGSSLALTEKVWKKPLLMFAPGSVFRIKDNLQDYYGSLIPQIHYHNSEIVHYALAFPLGIKLTFQDRSGER